MAFCVECGTGLGCKHDVALPPRRSVIMDSNEVVVFMADGLREHGFIDKPCGANAWGLVKLRKPGESGAIFLHRHAEWDRQDATGTQFSWWFAPNAILDTFTPPDGHNSASLVDFLSAKGLW